MQTNDTLKTIAERFSCRGYNASPVEREKLDAIARAAMSSPSAINLQPWRLVVITDAELIAQMDEAGMQLLRDTGEDEMYKRFMERGGKLFYNAPVMFLILKQHIASAELDCGIVSENIALAASSLGLGNVICGMARLPFECPKGEYFKEKVGFGNDGWEFGMGVLVGYGLVSKEPHAPDMSKVSYV
ncbi:MAG: nitroreductase family protein [Oscillospiraceae bacterium]|jgi:nitroreductase|nr:nitroreductase family protein [Oscillospiraceae bacterium]